MSEKIVQLNEEVIKGQLKELVRGSVEETLNELLEGQLQQTQKELDMLRQKVSAPIDMVGQTVLHKVFKEGKVLSQTGDVQLIAFSAGEKKFQFPQAYTGGFLKANDTIMAMIHDRQSATQVIGKLEAQLKDKV